jgi:chromosome segregation ATPase
MYKQCLQEFKDELDKCKKDADTFLKSLQESKDELDKCKKDADTFLKSLQESKDELDNCKKDFDTYKERLQEEGDRYKADRDKAIEEVILLFTKKLDAVTTLELKLRKMEAECTPLNNNIMDDGSLAENLVQGRAWTGWFGTGGPQSG